MGGVYVLLYIIINENAGKGKGKKNWGEIHSYLRQYEIPFIYDKTRYKGHGIQLVKQKMKLRNISSILCIGGDGTLQEIVDSLQEERSVPIGIIPSGTGNDFAKSNSIPFHPIESLHVFLQNNLSHVDIGMLKDEQEKKIIPFINSIGIGFDAEVIRFIENSRLKKLLHFLKLGDFVYIIAAIRTFFSYQPRDVSCTIYQTNYSFQDVWFFVIANHSFYGGGIPISPLSKNNDQQFELIVIQQRSKWKMVFTFLSLLQGKHLRNPSSFQRNISSVSFDFSSKQSVQIDGEYKEIQKFSVFVSNCSQSFFIK